MTPKAKGPELAVIDGEVIEGPDEPKARGRKAEPFADNSFGSFSLTLSFHNDVSEADSGAVIAAVLESVDAAVESAALASKRVARVTKGKAEALFYRQTLKVAPESYKWPEAGASGEHGVRTSAEIGNAARALARASGKTTDQIMAAALAAYMAQEQPEQPEAAPEQ